MYASTLKSLPQDPGILLYNTVPPKLIHSCLVPKINNEIQGKVMYASILKSLPQDLEYCCTTLFPQN